MLPWIRRLLTVLVVALLTAGGTLWWLYDGDLAQGVEPVVDDLPPLPELGLPAHDGAGAEESSGYDAPPDVLPGEGGQGG